VKGDVVILPFPFDDLSQTKHRPAIVVAAPSGLSLVVAQITGQIYRDAFAIPITAADFVTGSIHKDSYIRANILFTVKAKKILQHAGTVTAAKMKEVTDRVVYLITN
jgi:mRNA interferase MazF